MTRWIRCAAPVGLVVMALATAWIAGERTDAAPAARPVPADRRARPMPTAKPAAARLRYRSPTCVAIAPDGKLAYVTCHTADSVAVIDTAAGKVIAEVPVGRGPTGIAVSGDGRTVFVANTQDHNVGVIDAGKGKQVATIACGYEPTGLVASRDGKRLYTANYISDDVSVIDVPARKEIRRIKVGRAPTYLALTSDGRKLLVNNSLSHQPATNPELTSFVSVIDTTAGEVIARKRSPGTMLGGMGVAISPDDKFAFAVHARPNFNIVTSQLQQGWVQTHALTIIPLTGAGKVVSVLLDNVNSGAANPHGVAVSKDGQRLFVMHRGIHKASVIDLPKLLGMLARATPEVLATAHTNLGLLWQRGDIVRRVTTGGRGPNGVAASPTDGSVYVANYFSDQVAVLDGRTGALLQQIDLGGPAKMDLVRRGEFLFNDAEHCFQQWLSCTSCHPRARVDGVNWDLLNDGMTNPKNAKSLVGSWQTPPAMALGVRASMEVAVEKGFLFIQFAKATPEELKAVRAFLRAEPYIRSPWSRNADGTLDAQAVRGKKVFQDAGCASCHPAPRYTDLRSYDVGTQGPRDFENHKAFDTPSLTELYRTGPYLHDGRAATLKDVFSQFNPDDEHGVTAKLTARQLDDLVAFLKSL